MASLSNSKPDGDSQDDSTSQHRDSAVADNFDSLIVCDDRKIIDTTITLNDKSHITANKQNSHVFNKELDQQQQLHHRQSIASHHSDGDDDLDCATNHQSTFIIQPADETAYEEGVLNATYIKNDNEYQQKQLPIINGTTNIIDEEEEEEGLADKNNTTMTNQTICGSSPNDVTAPQKLVNKINSSSSIRVAAKPTTKLPQSTTILKLQTPLTRQNSTLSRASSNLSVSSTATNNNECLFEVNDHVYVDGLRSGVVRFVGETKFGGAGLWVGVDLELEQGKNDGSVDGVRYFDCKPKHGVFVRPKRITSSIIKHQHQSNLQKGGASKTISTNLKPSTITTTTGDLGSKLKMPATAVSSINSLASSSLVPPSASISKLRRAQSSLQEQQHSRSAYKTSKAPTSIASSSSSSRASSGVSSSSATGGGFEQQHQFKLNQRVLVNSSSGLKSGTLRFLGNTDFGAGLWAGVELDEASGKNDGSVAGKRYFTCPTSYGLFAPLSRIQKLTPKLELQYNKGGLPHTIIASAINQSSKLQQISTPIARLNKSDSRESVNSINSIRSTGSANNCTSKLPVRSTSNLHTNYNYNNNQYQTFKMPQNPSVIKMGIDSVSTSNKTGTQSTSMGLHNQDVDLLIKERDNEREENHKLQRRLEELEERLLQSELDKSRMTNEADDEIVELKRLSQELEDENKKLQEKWDQEKQFHSEAQFKYDELEVLKSDLQQQLKEKERRLSQMEQSQNNGVDQLSVAGSQMSLMSSGVTKLDRSATTKAKYEKEIASLKEQIITRDEQLIQLRTSLEMRKNEVKNLQTRVVDIERNLKTETERNDRHLKKIDDINLELKASETKLAAKLEENMVYEKQVRKLRNDLRNAEEKLEQLSLSKKKDVEILHNKLSHARRGSATNTPTSPVPPHVSTPTPQDEMVRLQMEIRDLKDQLIDREAEVDYNKRELDLLKHKLETRSLEVDSNNQELARRCQDLLEQNRKSEDTVKQLMRSTTEHSQQLIRATEDLKEANGKCLKLREEISELESNMNDQLQKNAQLKKENAQLRQESEDYKDQLDAMRQELQDLQQQLDVLREQLSKQTNNLDQDRDTFANRLSQSEKENSQLRHDLQTQRQDLRTSKNQCHDLQLERDRFKADLDVKEKYVESRNDIIETLRHELDDCRRSLDDHKRQLDQLQRQSQRDSDHVGKELRATIETLRKECQQLKEDSGKFKQEAQQLQNKLDQQDREYQQRLNREKGDIREELEEECKRLDQMYQRSMDQFQEKSDRLRQVQQEHDQNLLNLEDLYRKERDDLQQRVRLLEKELDGMQYKLESMKTEADEAKAKLAQEREQNQQQTLEMSSDITTDRGSQVSTKFIHHHAPTTSTTSSPQPLGSQTMDNANWGSRAMSLGEREEYESQIEFLNSVIVDMQKKCDELKARVATMEELNLEDFDAKSKEIKRLLARQKRMYCDNCERFDLHYTDQCVKHNNRFSTVGGTPGSAKPLYESAQSLNRYENNNRHNDNHDDTGPNSNRYFQTLRKPAVPRPYCDHCEMFGHDLKSCDFFKN